MENKIKHSDEDTPRTERVITSNDLLNEVNEEREKQGLHEIPAVNSRSGGNTYARLDKSFKWKYRVKTKSI